MYCTVCNACQVIWPCARWQGSDCGEAKGPHSLDCLATTDQLARPHASRLCALSRRQRRTRPARPHPPRILCRSDTRTAAHHRNGQSRRRRRGRHCRGAPSPARIRRAHERESLKHGQLASKGRARSKRRRAARAPQAREDRAKSKQRRGWLAPRCSGYWRCCCILPPIAAPARPSRRSSAPASRQTPLPLCRMRSLGC